jgi:hypothetical protein
MVFSLMLPVTAQAATFEFPREIRAGDTALTLRGQGTLRVGLAFRIYHAAFYLGADHDLSKALEDVPMRLDVKYFRSVSRDQLISVGDKILREIATPGELAAIQGRVDQINQWYESVDRGDVYSLVYLPDQGLKLLRNGDWRGTIEGHDFARLYLRIWLGEHSQSRGLNRKLLGEE